RPPGETATARSRPMHFYEQTETGVEARHFVPLVSRPQEIRPTRISDVRKWWAQGREVYPSVTTVLQVLAKPGLQNWIVDQHLRQAWCCDQSEFEDGE